MNLYVPEVDASIPRHLGGAPSSPEPNAGLKALKRLGDVISRRLTGAYRDLLSARGQGTVPSWG
jgi:hypothetical protein